MVPHIIAVSDSDEEILLFGQRHATDDEKITDRGFRQS
jgi:hypothetical protein